MTTIATTTTEMSCDCRISYGKTYVFTGDTKIIAVPPKAAKDLFGINKGYIGFAGEVGKWSTVVSWLSSMEGKPPKVGELMAFILLTDTKEIWHANDLTEWMKVKDPYFAIGSGAPYALGALANGANTLDACKIAAKFDPSSGKPFKTYKL
jgi:hypothetical protein